jgi:hypothetical protein
MMVRNSLPLAVRARALAAPDAGAAIVDAIFGGWRAQEAPCEGAMNRLPECVQRAPIGAGGLCAKPAARGAVSQRGTATGPMTPTFAPRCDQCYDPWLGEA